MGGGQQAGAGPEDSGLEFGQVIVRAAANGHDLDGLVRPLLEALAKVSGLDTTYLTVVDWDRRSQTVRFVHSTDEITVREGHMVGLPEGLTPELLPGVTRSPDQVPAIHPDSWVARRMGLKTYVSVPVMLAEHELYGMLCGASLAKHEVTEHVVTVMEFFAQIISDHVVRTRTAATVRRAAVAERQLRTRAQFLGEAEHRLKTPLTVLQGVSGALLDHGDDMEDEQRKHFLESMVRNAEELTRLVNDLLTEARSEVQARELAPIRLELRPFTDMIAEAFTCVSTSHRVIGHVSPGAVAVVDPSALYQVLGHLLDNAVKYSPDGGTITVRVDSTLGGIQIAVTDEGIGLPENIDVFAPFQRGDSDVTGQTPGVGLGLHIVRNLVDSMGGSLVAQRNSGKGSTFTVRLPSGL